MEKNRGVARGVTKGKSFINMDGILKKLAKDKGVNDILQKAVYTKAVVRHQQVYDLHYKALVKNIMMHLQRGFPGAANNTAVTVLVPSINKGPALAVKAGQVSQWDDKARAWKSGGQWKKLSDSYRYQKGLNHAGTQRKTNRPRSVSRSSFAGNTSDLFWVFKRNLASRLAAGGFSPQAVSVTAHENTVKRGGVLARGRNGFTIGYTAGLKFSTLPTPLNDMVRTPFMRGKTAGPADLSRGAFGKGNNRGLHVLALVEARRPFIMELSGAVGRMARQRLGIKR